MKKYKLLKDLPLYPAGTICTIVEESIATGLFDGEVVRKVDGTSEDVCPIMSCGELAKIREKGTFDEWFEEIKESKVWEPKEGEKYYFVTDMLITLSATFRGTSWPYDRDRYQIGNCFKTKEDAEKAVEKLKALRRLREKGLRFESWNYGIPTSEHRTIIKIKATADENTYVHDDLSLLFDEEDV